MTPPGVRRPLAAVTLAVVLAIAPPAPAAHASPPVRIVAVGDIMLGSDYPENRLPADDGRGQLAGAREILRGADLAIGNFEGTLADGLPPAKVCGKAKNCYLFRTPTRFAATLADAGFDILGLANNHACDFGEAGRSSTMTALDRAGIRHSGRVGDIAAVEINGRPFALIAFAPGRGSHSLGEIDAAADLVRQQAAAGRQVIVSMHGGAEGEKRQHVVRGEELFLGEKRGNLVAFAHAVIDAGAALVVGHGPHVPRALELYRGRLIAYSLGNFATYYGISIAGTTGVAPLLEIEIDDAGRLLGGRVHSFRQQRAEGPVVDPRHNAFKVVRELTAADFAGGGLVFTDDGRFRPAEGPP